MIERGGSGAGRYIFARFFYGGASSPPGRSAEWRRIKNCGHSQVCPMHVRAINYSIGKLHHSQESEQCGVHRGEAEFCGLFRLGFLQKFQRHQLFLSSRFFEATRARLNINEGQQDNCCLRFVAGLRLHADFLYGTVQPMASITLQLQS